MKKIYIFSTFIFGFRLLDLFSTKLAVHDFKNQEQNILVKFFNLNIYIFFIVEIFLAFFFVFCYIYYYKNKKVFEIKKETLIQYLKNFFFKKNNPKIIDWLFNMSFKRVIILFGSIIPIFIITTSIIFSLNNYWVYLFNKGNETAIKYYLCFNSMYFFDFIIFVFPPLFLFFLLYKKLYNSFNIYKKI